MKSGKTSVRRSQAKQLAALRAQLTEVQETLRAIREGEVDAIVVASSRGEPVFSLSGAEQVYRLVVETMKEAAVTVSLDGTILFANSQFRQLVKRLAREIVGHPLAEFVAPHMASAVPALLLTSQTQPVKQRLEFLEANGTFVPTHISTNPLRQADGVSICMVASDLTGLENSTNLVRQLQQQKESLREGEERLQFALESSHIGAWELNLADFTVSCSPEFSRIFGYMVLPPRWTYDLILEHVLPEDRAALDKTLRESIAKRGSWRTEYRIRCADSEIRWVSAAGRHRSDTSGETRRMTGIVTDITDRKQVQQQLQDQRKLLEQTVVERTAQLGERMAQLRSLNKQLIHTEEQQSRHFAKILHDDLQQLLVAAGCRAQVLQIQFPKLAENEDLTALTDILAQSLHLTRSLTAELYPRVLYQEGFTAAVNWLADWFQKTHGLQVRVQAEQEADLLPPGETRVALFQGLRELLFNVVKHAGVRTAEVHLSRNPSGGMRTVVSDQGAGFDPANSAGKAAADGSFGLFSLRERLDLLGGKLKIESAPGQGCRCELLVPEPPSEGKRENGEAPAAKAS